MVVLVTGLLRYGGLWPFTAKGGQGFYLLLRNRHWLVSAILGEAQAAFGGAP